ncbi:MAG: hypothetical protein J1F35_07880 [Erysipelotrichales bacterium]|nr:hypothetical protein [Erysipelotrichales bacterium]
MNAKIFTKIYAKKILGVFLGIAILAIPFGIYGINKTYAASFKQTVATKYFYGQLKDKNKQVFYKAMEDMLEKGFFKVGNVSVEVIGLTSTDQQVLMKDMGAARDAFLLDYPELFYVDFDYLSLRGSTDAKGELHIYLGTGRGDTYINQEFLNEKDGSINSSKINTAIKTVDARIDAIVDKASKKPSVREQITLAHDEVIKAAKYTLEYKTKYPYTVRTIYGVFGLGSSANGGNAVCEGYARALKSILDRLGIPAILVRGIYDDNGTPQEHMWVYVQVDGKWYGIDPTFDNTDDDKEAKDNVSNKYLLVDAGEMNNHYPIGIISSSDFEFTYPDLNLGVSENNNDYSNVDASKIVYKDANGLLVVDAGQETLGSAKPEKVFHISYNGKGYAKAAEEDGIYIITNSWQVKDNGATGEEDKIPSDWLYPSDVGSYQNIYQDTDEYLAIRVDNVTALQVGLTEVPQGSKTEGNYYGVFYEGGKSGIIAMSTDIETGVGKIDYAQPFPVKTTPSQTIAYKVGKNKSYDIEVTYDQDLIYENNQNPKIDIDLKIYDMIYGYRDEDKEYLKYEISKPVLKDKRTIAFTIKPSELWTMDKVNYIVQFTGVVGELSKKEPYPVIYGFSNDTTGCIYALRAMGVDMESYSKPTLIDDFDLEDILSEDFINYETLQKYGDFLKNRLSLMVTNTTDEQEKKMENALLEELGDKHLDNTNGKTNVEMYNITLSLCTEQLKKLKDGTKLKVMLAFPRGYTYEDFLGGKDGNSPITFKAYHYNLKEDGSYAIEEIDCIVTELGLIIYVDSFSPFAIAAVNEEPENTDRNVIFNVTEGGSVITNSLADSSKTEYANVASNYYFDKKGVKHTVDVNKRRFTVVPNDGYSIEKVERVTEITKNSKGEVTSYKTEVVTLDENNSFELDYKDEDLFDELGVARITVTFTADDTGYVGDVETGEIVDPKTGEVVDPGNGETDDPEPENPDDNYEFIEGANSELDPAAGSKLTFRINIPYDKFISEGGKVYIDGKLVDKKFYEVTEGSTIITFTDEYVASLASGKHTINLTLNDGTEVTTTFNIKRNDSDSFDDLKPSESDAKETDEVEQTKSSGSNSNNPQTSVMNLKLYVIVAIGSLAGIVYLIRKKIA